MPIAASSLEASTFLRMLVMGVPKKGKSTHVISTAPGPVRVLLCEDDSALLGARRETKGFDYERVRNWNDMMKFTVEAKRDAKEGKIKTVVVDPLNMWADRLMGECVEATKTKEGNEDGRKAHPEFTKRIKHACDLLMTIPAHLIVITHFMEVGGDDGSDKPKHGRGIVPLMPNTASRTAIHAMFFDVVWFDVAVKDKPSFNNRIFVTGADACGPGCRTLPNAGIMPAHIAQFIEAQKKQAKIEGLGSNGVAAVASKPVAKPSIQPRPR